MGCSAAFIGDIHACESSRFAETIRVCDWIADDIERRKVCISVLVGDIYTRTSRPAERLYIKRWLERLAQTAKVVIVRGNHDAPTDLMVFDGLASGRVQVIERACVLRDGLTLMCLPWPDKAELALSGADPAQALRDLLIGLGKEATALGGPKVLVGHGQIRNCRTSTGQQLVGGLEVGLEDILLAGADFVVFGHIHLPQHWVIGNHVPVVYTGSPKHTDFGEQEDKGYVIAQFEGDKLQSWEEVRTPANKMFDLQVDWSPNLDVDKVAASVLAQGAEIRVKTVVPAQERGAAKLRMDELKKKLEDAGAVVVQVDAAVAVTTRARIPEVAAAKTLAAKLEAMWASGEAEMTAEKRESLLGKLALVEQEVQNAE